MFYQCNSIVAFNIKLSLAKTKNRTVILFGERGIISDD